MNLFKTLTHQVLMCKLIVKTIFSLPMFIIQTEKDNDDGWCEVDERPSGVTDTLLQ